MKIIHWCTGLLVLSLAGSSLAQSDATERGARIRATTVPLPPHLRTGAAVYDLESNPPALLREGSNGILCFTDAPTPGYEVSCLDESWLPYTRRYAALRAEGRTMLDTHRIINRELAEGSLPLPAFGAIGNVASGPNSADLDLLSTLFVGPAGDELGLPTVENEKTWLMCAGTPQAHIMIGLRPYSIRNENVDHLCGLD